jgi:pimeloyl-[acyl-carrier protein] methyl ester esterase
MELVFVHGWGFDAGFWDALCPHLAEFRQQRVDLGFFGPPAAEKPSEHPCVLIGHSLGFVHALRRRQHYTRWVAINSFARFVRDASPSNRKSRGQVRDLRRQLAANPEKTMRAFYHTLGVKPMIGPADVSRLTEGLNELLAADVTETLASLDVPGLILASRKDPLIPIAVSEGLEHSAKRGRILWHDTANHIIPQSDPGWCASAIRAFLKS